MNSPLMQDAKNALDLLRSFTFSCFVRERNSRHHLRNRTRHMGILGLFVICSSEHPPLGDSLHGDPESVRRGYSDCSRLALSRLFLALPTRIARHRASPSGRAN